MRFVEILERARSILERRGRVSVRVLKREFELDDEGLEILIEELVDVQQVAARQGKLLTWLGSSAQEGDAQDEAAHGRGRSGQSVPSPTERRQLTVLFCDLVGSTDLSRRVDAEDLRDIVRVYHDAAAAAIDRHEGHVAQYLGDGLLVYFGYPQAQDDAAERAVRAGLSIIDEISSRNDSIETDHGVRLAVRVGIHTGSVVIGELGRGESREILAVGKATNVAARLQALAPEDGVLISDATRSLVGEDLQSAPLGEPEVRGIGPIRVHRAHGFRSAALANGWSFRPARVELFGRESELALLEQRLRSTSEGNGQVVLISGDAGIGKSALVDEFRRRVGTRSTQWLRCRAGAHRRNTPLHPMVDLLRQILPARPGRVFSPSEEDLKRAGFEGERSLALLAPLLGWTTPDQPHPNAHAVRRYERTLDLLAEWVIDLGRSKSAVLVVEDIHWADPSTLDLLERVIQQIPRSFVMLVASFRPEFVPPWPARSFVTPLSVSRLDASSVRALIERTFNERSSSSESIESIIRRADGNPLYARELTLSWIDGPADAADVGRPVIPMTLQDSLMSKLDRLGDAKEVVLIASVLGRDFQRDDIASLSGIDDDQLDDSLERIEKAELIYPRRRAGKVSYTFSHALVHECAYSALLRRRRRELHRAVAQLLREREQPAGKAQPEVLAFHLASAGEHRAAAVSLRLAAESALAAGAALEAEHLYSEAIANLERAPSAASQVEELLALHLKLGQLQFVTHGYGSERARSSFERARSLSAEIDDKRRAATLLLGLWGAEIAQAGLQSAIELSDQLVELTSHEVGSASRTWALMTVGLTRLERGEFEPAMAGFERAVASHDPAHYVDEAMDPGVRAYALMARCAWVLGREVESDRHADSAFRLCDSPIRSYERASAHVWAANLALMKDDPNAAMSHATAAARICEGGGYDLRMSEAEMFRGWALVRNGDVRAGMSEFDRGFDRYLRTGTALGHAMFVAFGVETFLLAGELERARDRISYADPDVTPDYATCLLLIARGRLRSAEGDSSGAAGDFERAVEVARFQGAVVFERRASALRERLEAS